MSKIVFFDIDGTLLDRNKQLPALTKKAIEQLKQNGVFVAIATGRAPFMYESLRGELDIDSYISFNGQYVVFENEVIYKNPMQTKEIEKLLHFTKEKEHPMVFLDELAMSATVPDHEFIHTSISSLKFPYPMVNADYYIDRDIYQSLVFCEEEFDELYERNFPNSHFIRWHKYSTDVLPAGGSKAEGIKRMINRLGFRMEDVYAFGDGLNDIEMLQTVGTGVAMGNSSEQVKKAADLTTTSVDEDGIWNGLKKLDLI
ncbi:Cof subfamily protein (haloacid dehalogenase superfamily) [Cytobacillus eiseniae]|uniref:Cof subfamily protein (Haloacid dehalogenase superfamily) n=1 Tax=Cytobacillus eiseniae TaxID=762947 RepID=A0ABS4RAN6_9BACI|nr:Cof-type HAD-IIB family hydrolase [Cytobacillus eiseniae]MBP2239958.1 Cof subfamily protein (haloacid dehalogenase superfamily) [Cytobacillus eiseniae]